MAAATEWLNALAAGSDVVSVRRREPERRPLNLPRQLFTRRGLAAYHDTGPDERRALLGRWSTPSYPPGRAWDEPVERARRAGRFRVAAELNGADQVICATGFTRGYRARSAARAPRCRARARHGGQLDRPRAGLHGRSLTDGERTLAIAGVAGQWAFPAADTLMGAKSAARGFVRKVRRVVHAERPDRVAPRGRARAAPRGWRSLPWSSPSGGRSRSRGHGRRRPGVRPSSSTGGSPTSPVGFRCRSPQRSSRRSWARLCARMSAPRSSRARLLRRLMAARPDTRARPLPAPPPLVRGGRRGARTHRTRGRRSRARVARALRLGVALAMQPPTVRLSAGVHEGPLVLDRAQHLVGEPGAVVRGGIA